MSYEDDDLEKKPIDAIYLFLLIFIELISSLSLSLSPSDASAEYRFSISMKQKPYFVRITSICLHVSDTYYSHGENRYHLCALTIDF